MSLLDALLPEFDREFGVTRVLLDRLPADALDWRPHERSMSLGQLASHLVGLPRRVGVVMTCDRFDLASATEVDDPSVHPSETLGARFDAEVATARRALVEAAGGSFEVPWTLARGATTVFTMPRHGVLRYFVFNHLVHHRGQLTVYLRMRGGAIPALYGPSADEGGFRT